MKWMLLLTLLLALPAGSQEGRGSYTGFVRCQGRGWAALRSLKEYQDFVARIPPQRVQQKQPAPPSDDPLLRLPPFDFDKEALVVAWSDNIHVISMLEEPRREGEDLVVGLGYNVPPGLPGYAAPHGIGHYHLLRVPAFPGQLRIRKLPGGQP